MRIKRKKIYANPVNGRKELFHFMSRAKYPKVDRMMLHLARQKTHAPALNSDVPIHYIMPSIPIQTIEPTLIERSVVGAHQQPSEGVEESKEQVAEVLATAIVDPGLENIIVDKNGSLYNPKTNKNVQDNPSSRKRIHAYGKVHGYGPPKTPSKASTPTTPKEQSDKSKKKRK
jgi:hypothetical protein